MQKVELRIVCRISRTGVRKVLDLSPASGFFEVSGKDKVLFQKYKLISEHLPSIKMYFTL